MRRVSERRFPIDEPLIAEVYRQAFSEEGSSLPRGRHGLSREQVATAQKARIILATAEVVTELSYAKTTTRAIVDRAGVSTKTFYANFSGKEEAFLATYTLLDGVMVEGTKPPVEVSQPRTATRRAVAQSLAAMASWPLFTRMRMVEGRAAGAEVERHRMVVVQGVVDVTMASIEAARRVDARVGAPSEGAVLALMIGLSELMARHVIDHGPETLPSLEDVMVEAIERMTYGDPPPFKTGE